MPFFLRFGHVILNLTSALECRPSSSHSMSVWDLGSCSKWCSGSELSSFPRWCSLLLSYVEIIFLFVMQQLREGVFEKPLGSSFHSLFPRSVSLFFLLFENFLLRLEMAPLWRSEEVLLQKTEFGCQFILNKRNQSQWIQSMWLWVWKFQAKQDQAAYKSKTKRACMWERQTERYIQKENSKIHLLNICKYFLLLRSPIPVSPNPAHSENLRMKGRHQKTQFCILGSYGTSFPEVAN